VFLAGIRQAAHVAPTAGAGNRPEEAHGRIVLWTLRSHTGRSVGPIACQTPMFSTTKTDASSASS
jgi:hypothetical protein